ncbi:MAG: LPS export ABC transporter periplasmic protein LptC [Candidatus Eremiobacter antarcticus]|nr:LPS export ABC transporter periplasmic protein LptC [Candidatus Eremiobacteraeota bacterium]MBC5808262.1 LPS export ABC transporter periplasmic protein LptC [Candidatus Eremiobacteraeota bacterium]PZR63645.1 MAG: LPS export ABC transporter periplasmic protein LptC [Candidatus Eremiobacter sp. RRmetagenome_bin22]
MTLTKLVARCALVTASVAALCLSSRSPALASAQIGRFTINFNEGVFHRNGDFVIPGRVTGNSPDGDFVSDRAVGNYQRQDVTLIGHVVLHQHLAAQRGPAPDAMTLTSDQLRINGQTRTYAATGAVTAVQGSRTLQAGSMQLDDRTHEAVLQKNVHVRENDRQIDSEEIHYNTVSGALIMPVPVSGRGSDGDFRADRAEGNQLGGRFTLIGNVVLHRASGVGRGTLKNDPLTLWCDRLDVDNRTRISTATGHVRIAQANRTLSGPYLRLDDNTHIGTMTGGVHGEQIPDRTFDAAELIYNTETEDFKALGGVQATFPYRRPSPSPSATPRK